MYPACNLDTLCPFTHNASALRGDENITPITLKRKIIDTTDTTEPTQPIIVQKTVKKVEPPKLTPADITSKVNTRLRQRVVDNIFKILINSNNSEQADQAREKSLQLEKQLHTENSAATYQSSSAALISSLRTKYREPPS